MSICKILRELKLRFPPQLVWFKAAFFVSMSKVLNTFHAPALGYQSAHNLLKTPQVCFFQKLLQEPWSQAELPELPDALV